jgi:hypothetical protein
MKRTPGPWALRGYQVRADAGRGAHVADYRVSHADGRLIAAAPELLEWLDAACRSLDAAEGGASCHGTAFTIRERMHALGLWDAQCDAHGHPNFKEDPADLDPDLGPSPILPRERR